MPASSGGWYASAPNALVGAAGAPRRLVPLRHERLGRRVERLVAEGGAVLQIELEAAGLPEPVHRWRREDDDEGVGDAGELPVQAAGDRAGAQGLRLALVEVGERGEDDARV